MLHGAQCPCTRKLALFQLAELGMSARSISAWDTRREGLATVCGRQLLRSTGYDITVLQGLACVPTQKHKQIARPLLAACSSPPVLR